MTREKINPDHSFEATRMNSIGRWFRKATSPVRVMPDFIIIGAQRCGTTSLFRYLERHPDVVPAAVKEIHYFDHSYHLGPTWYRSFFPTRPYLGLAARLRRRTPITGEASPYYVFHPFVPQRVFQTVPGVRLVLLLRNPVDRAFSHYRHMVKEGLESAPSFAEAIRREPQRLAGAGERLLADSTAASFEHCHFSYVARGVYVDQLMAWRRLFPREQILILKSEEFFGNTRAIFNRVLSFLGLAEWDGPEFAVHNRTSGASIDPGLRRQLADYYAPHNQRLYEYLGTDFGWKG